MVRGRLLDGGWLKGPRNVYFDNQQLCLVLHAVPSAGQQEPTLGLVPPEGPEKELRTTGKGHH